MQLCGNISRHKCRLYNLHFDVVSLMFRRYELVQYFLNVFYTKTRLSEGLFLLKTMFPTILDMKNAHRVQNSSFLK